MRYPSRTDYTQAVRDYPHISILDPKLKSGKPQRGANHDVIVYSGGFSSVFPIEVESSTYALRCWIRDVGDVETRYQEISNHLARQSNIPYFVEFEYVREGILVNGAKYPITHMKWAEGETLRDFIEQNLSEPWLLKTAAKRFHKMVATLHAHQISHGDLQDGNILLNRNGADVEIKLIDYDSLFVPALRGQPDSILGLPEYQHPQRLTGAGDANENVDYFSELVIYLSFIALAEKPELWSQFGGQTERGLLFTAEDFRSSDESEVFRELENLSPNVRQLASKLREFCAKPSIDALEPLEAVVPIADLFASVWKIFSKNKLATVLAICIVAFFMQMNSKNEAIRQNEVLQNENASLQKQLEARPTTEELNTLENENTRLLREDKRLQNENTSLQKQIEARPTAEELNTLENENARLLREDKRLQNENTSLQKQLEARLTIEELDTLENENARLLRENQKLQSENAALQKQRNAEAPEGTLPVEEVPSISGKFLHRLTGHTGGILSVAFSPDGQTIASGSTDSTIRLWDSVTGVHQRTLAGHAAQVYCVAFSPDGRTLASGSDDETVRLWDAVTGTPRRTLAGHNDWVYSVVFSHDGRMLASGSDDETIRLWDIATGVHQRTLIGHTGPVRSVAFSSDGQTLASGGWDMTIHLWDVVTGVRRHTLTGHTDWVYSVAFSPDGRTLGSGSWDRTIRLWDAVTGAHQWTLTGHSAGVYSIAFSPDGRTLASGGMDHTVRLWDVVTGRHLQTLTGHTEGVYSVGFRPDSRMLASGSLDKTIRLID